MTLHRIVTLHRSLALTLGAGLALACSDSDSPAAPDEFGTVQGFVADGSGPAPSPAYEGGGSFSGTLQASTELEVYSEAEGWVSLGDPLSVQLQLQSADEAPCGASTAVPAGTYARVRMTIANGEANIAAGATLGGLVLSSAVTVMLGSSGEVVVEKEVQPFEIRADATTQVRFDLNSEAWVTEESVSAEAATEASVQAAATVEVS